MPEIRAQSNTWGRATALLVEGSIGGVSRLVTAAIERRGRGFDAVYRATGVASGERDELVALIGSRGAPWRDCSADDALARLAEAVVMTRIARRPIPRWLLTDEALLETLERRVVEVTDVYRCDGCEAPLPAEAQIALARGRGVASTCTSCPSCQGLEREGATPAPVAHAWIALEAGEPRRALMHAARAEAQRAGAHLLDPIRGAALLALSNPVDAAAHLRRAVHAYPDDLRIHGWLVEALARAGYHASATAELDRLGRARPQIQPHLASVRRALGATEPHAREASTPRHLKGALASLAAAC